MPPSQYNLPTPDDRVTVTCLYCNKSQDVARKALTITCRHCNKRLALEDKSLKDYTARRVIDTCGIVTVEKRGHVVVTDMIDCGGMVVRGRVKGDIQSRGLVIVGPEAQIKGNVTAPSIAISAGSILEGYYRIG